MEQQPVDLSAPALVPEEPPPPPPPCVGEDIAIVVQGTTWTMDGFPVAGVPVGLAGAPGQPRSALAFTGVDGRYQLDLPDAGLIRPLDRPSWPPALCVGIPLGFAVNNPSGAKLRMIMRGNDLIVPPTCAVQVTLPSDLPPEAELLVHDGTWVHRAGPLPEAAGGITLPCDARAFAVIGGGRATSSGGSCPWGDPWICAEGPFDALRTVGTRAVRAQVRARDGGPIAATVHAVVGARQAAEDGTLSVELPDGPQRLTIQSRGTLPRTVDAAEQLVITLEPARMVAIRCAGQPDDRCPMLPSIRKAADPDALAWPCEVERGRTWCAAPIDQDAVLLAPGRRITLPASQESGWIDLRSWTATVTGLVDGDCRVRADRDVSDLGGRWRAMIDEPRIFHADGHCEGGSFRLGPLSPGRWTLTITRPDQESWERSVHVGADPVDLGPSPN